MKKILIGLVIFIALIIGGYYLLIYFIGAGVVGRIEDYDFNTSIQQLEKGISEVNKSYEEIEKINSDDYFDLTHSSNNAKKNPLYEDFKAYDAKYSHLSIIVDDKKYIFRFRVQENDSTSRITLVSAAEYGEGIDFA